MILTAINALPTEVIDVANRPTAAQGFVLQAKEVWDRFSSYGHRLITENLTTVLCIAPAIVLNVLYALQHLLASLACSEQNELCAAIASRMHVCKSRGAPLSTFLALAAALAISGFLYYSAS